MSTWLPKLEPAQVNAKWSKMRGVYPYAYDAMERGVNSVIQTSESSGSRCKARDAVVVSKESSIVGHL